MQSQSAAMVPRGRRRRRKKGRHHITVSEHDAPPAALALALSSPASPRGANQHRDDGSSSSGTSEPNLLTGLPDQLLLSVCMHLEAACDLARLELTTPRMCCAVMMSGGGGDGIGSCVASSVPECTAELLLAGHRDGWRVARRAGESHKHALFVLQRRLWSLPTVAAGGAHTLVAARGGLFAFGSNQFGQLGQRPGVEAAAASRYPGEVVVPHAVVSVAAAMHHSACVAAEGQLFLWGSDLWGREHSATQGQAAADAGGAEGAAPRQSRAAVVWSPRLSMAAFPQDTRVTLVSLGHVHAACLAATGDVFSWGDGRGCELCACVVCVCVCVCVCVSSPRARGMHGRSTDDVLRCGRERTVGGWE
jgi:hypothetical protein